MINPRIRKNISALYGWLFPIIIVSKIVRWTIMYEKLVAMSIGNGMIERMAGGSYSSILVAGLTEASSGANICENNCAWLLNHLNFFGISSLIGWEIFITVALNILLVSTIIDFYKKTPTAGKWENYFIYLGIAILNIFCFNLSKEPYQMLFFFLMAWGIKQGKDYNQKVVYLSIAIFITVLFARKYYALVLFYFFIINFVVRNMFESIDFSSKDGVKKLIQSSVITACIMGVAYLLVVSYFASANEEAYQGMVIANYRSTITNFVSDSEISPLFSSGNSLLMSIDYTIKIFRLLFPIELLLKGKVTYIFLIGFQCMLIYFIVQAFKRNQDLKEEEEEDEEEEEELEEEEEDKDKEEEDLDEDEIEARRRAVVERQLTRRCGLYLYLAFVLCSAAFEPDFGSWIRHQGVTLPILLLIL